MDKFSIEDFDSDAAFVRSVTTKQLGGRTTPLVGSNAAKGDFKLSVTTLSMSEVMQGAALYRPTSSSYTEFNNSLTSDLKDIHLNGIDGIKGNLGGRAQLLPFDLRLRQGLSDGSFGMEGAPGTTLPAVDGITLQGASGIRFVDANNLEGNTAAAREFITQNFQTGYSIGGYANRNIGGTNTPSDHAKGLALDVMVCKGGSKAEGTEKAMGDRIAAWFCANPDVFGVKYIIWMDRIITRGRKDEGWRSYGHPSGSTSNTSQHRDHVHISFEDTEQTALGTMGNPLTGGTTSGNP